jgi:hypothetical protein
MLVVAELLVGPSMPHGSKVIQTKRQTVILQIGFGQGVTPPPHKKYIVTKPTKDVSFLHTL